MERLINIDFTTPRDHRAPLFSWAVRKFQGTPYSHVLIRWTNSVGVEMVYEASGNQVKFLGPLATKGRYRVHKSYKIWISRWDYRKLIKICTQYAGVDYGQLQVLGIGLANLLGWKKNYLSRGESSQVCSELVARVFKHVLNWEIDFDPDLAGPREIDEYLARRKINNERT